MRREGHNGARTLGGLVLLLGLWGGLVPFVGPLFGYPMGNTSALVWNESHATLHVAPAIAAILGGLFLLGAPARAGQALGGLLGLIGGIWFVIAPSLSTLWLGGGGSGGHMTGMGGGTVSTLQQVVRPIGYHYGTGVLIAAFAAFALGLLATRQRIVERQATVVPVADKAVARERESARIG